MNRIARAFVGAAALAFALVALWQLQAIATATGAVGSTASAAQTQAVVDAASEFLASLDADQRASAQFDFTPTETASTATFARTAPGGAADGAQPPDQPVLSDQANAPPNGQGGGGGFVGEQYGQAVWSNYPVSDVPRPGVQLGSLDAASREAAMALLQTLLSPEGFQKVSEIMGSDQVLADSGQPFSSGEDVYTLGIFGTPDASEPWMVEFGGHHLGLNVVIAGEYGVVAPTLTGAQPAVYTAADGSTVRALAQENDKGFLLVNALDEDQQSKAILDYDVGDLVLGPGHDGETIVPEGLTGAEMTAEQRAMLLDLIGEWAGIIDDAYAAEQLAKYESELDDTYFAWSGPTTHEPDRNGSSYYRIQGPAVLIEFAPQGVGGDTTMHVHTVYRDLENDYGHLYTVQ